MLNQVMSAASGATQAFSGIQRHVNNSVCYIFFFPFSLVVFIRPFITETWDHFSHDHVFFFQLKKIGAKNIQAGVGCGVGFGHGFGVGK